MQSTDFSDFEVVHFDPFVGTEELGHLEMIGAIVHQLTRDLTEEQIRTAGFDAYFVDRTAGVYPTAASGFPYSAASMACKGDLIADLTEDLAADGAALQGRHAAGSAAPGAAAPAFAVTPRFPPPLNKAALPYGIHVHPAKKRPHIILVDARPKDNV